MLVRSLGQHSRFSQSGSPSLRLYAEFIILALLGETVSTISHPELILSVRLLIRISVRIVLTL